MINTTDTFGTKAFSVTSSDSANLAEPGFLYVGTSGNVKVDTLDGETVTFNSLAAGIVHPILVKKVYSTGTTASDILVVK